MIPLFPAPRPASRRLRLPLLPPTPTRSPDAPPSPMCATNMKIFHVFRVKIYFVNKK